MTDLDKLIEAVEGGEMDSPPIGKVFGISRKTKWASAAYHGSLDAAKALHEALLPGWAWSFFHTNDGKVGCHVELEDTVFNATPSRAWLLATLKAHRSQCPDKS